MKSKRYRYLGTTWTRQRLLDNHYFDEGEQELIETLNVGDSQAFLPRGSSTAYQLTRIQ